MSEWVREWVSKSVTEEWRVGVWEESVASPLLKYACVCVWWVDGLVVLVAVLLVAVVVCVNV